MGVCKISETVDNQTLQLISARQNPPQIAIQLGTKPVQNKVSSREPPPLNGQDQMNFQQVIQEGSECHRGKSENEQSQIIKQEVNDEDIQKRRNNDNHSQDQSNNSSILNFGQILLSSYPLYREPEISHQFIISYPKLTINT
ncbi:unnamed protein product (macronuclear) [Paramecium tetraurelia]|uniref:Uncharacterized protein n=1 Tax=Paramecium tetraurelia TaxID=5888 RepID=A0BN29_PARTE|nr:uncharacterized protein GSPATT00030584001 [Paramecium tetraurelia]CAK59946.1 unnamed protein product [Paramecium tetraurelia]|eukprot:XP_001427344.1 hypothetical protein (macronuclear) [Paramecium tetraurelia strain d4-2]